MKKPLSGIKVLDLSRLLPGPFCSLLLGDMGAEVVKVETKGQGDLTRWIPPLLNGTGASFVALNRGKKSITLDLSSGVARDALRRLAKNVDVLLESFRPGVLERLGLGYERLAGENERLVYCSLTGYGQEGPYRSRAGHDLNYQALAGILAFSGPPEGPPALPGAQVADLAGGSLYAAVSILAALYEREQSGKGQHLDISMTDGALSLMMLPLANHLAEADGLDPEEWLLSGGLVNYGTYRTRDGGALALGAIEPKFWLRFLERVGRPDLAEKAQSGGAAREEARAELAALIATRNRDEWMALLSDEDVCCEPVLEPDEVVHHPLHLARGMIREVEVRGGKPARTLVTALPFGRDDDGCQDRTLAPAPDLGEHGAEILAAFGFSAEEIDNLKAEGGL